MLVEDPLERLGTLPRPQPACDAEIDVFPSAVTEGVYLNGAESAIPGKIAWIWNPDHLEEELQEGPADSLSEGEANAVLPAEGNHGHPARDVPGDFVPDIYGADGNLALLPVVLEYRWDMEPADEEERRPRQCQACNVRMHPTPPEQIVERVQEAGEQSFKHGSPLS